MPHDQRHITYAWLLAHGFKLLERRDGQQTDHVRRGGNNSADPSVELAARADGQWLCQIDQQKPFCLRHRWEVIMVCKELTGRDWEGSHE